MHKNFCRTLVCCAPLLVLGCGDVNDPTIPSPQISTTAISGTSVSLAWSQAADTRSDTSALVYKVYQSGANPAYKSFDTIGEVEAGTLVGTVTGAGSITISSGISAGSAYYFNIVVLDEKGNKALYDPHGEYFHTSQVSYYPFSGNTNNAAAALNPLVLAVDATLPGLALPVLTSDRFIHTGSAYNFTPTSPQCLQSTALMGTLSLIGNASRSVSFWVQSSNTPAGTKRAPFAWGNEGTSGPITNGTSFGLFESGVVGNNLWNVWLSGTADFSTATAVTSSWEHWVVSYDSVANLIYAYQNGVRVPPGNNGTTPAVVPSTMDTRLYVGCGQNASGVLSYPYQGNIDDVRIFNQLLGSADVTNLYNTTRP